MLKKIFLFSVIIASFSQIALAESLNESNIYDKTSESSKKTISFSKNTKNEATHQEFLDDLEGTNSSYTLQKKTNKNFEIALALDDGTFSFLSTADTFDEALVLTNKHKTQKANSIFSIIDKNGYVVYSTNSMGRVIKHINGTIDQTATKNTFIYTSSNLKDQYTYINHRSIDDVPIIEDIGKVAKVMVSGYKGWINKDTSSNDFDLVTVPINHVKNPSHYYVKNKILYHFISSDILTVNKGFSIAIGPAPTYMAENIKYYSYDGKYFFKSLVSLSNNLKANTFKDSINAKNPFYSYYLNLPFRSKTNLSIDELNSYIEKNSKPHSKLRGTGKLFINAQNTYGVNALLALSVAINESAFGTSKISLEKNNIFGIGAIDASANSSAKTYASINDCIIDFTKNKISTGYANPKSWVYNGGFLGNKYLGANLKYASDPFWGEKAAQHAFNIDYIINSSKINKLKDFNYYQLAIHSKSSNIINNSKDKLYISKLNTPTIIVDKRLYTIGNKKHIRLLPDNPLPHSNNFQGVYHWNNHGFAPSDSIQYINKGKYNLVFTDIQGHFAQKVIEEFAFKGFTVGYTDGSFKPNNPISRAEFIKFVNMSLNFSTKGKENFSDVTPNHWFYDQVRIAMHYGYISGTLDKFRPNDFITREEAAAIITSLTNSRDPVLDKLSKYKDKKNVSSWALSSVEGSIERGYMGQGSLTFLPKSKLTRAEAVVILDRISKAP